MLAVRECSVPHRCSSDVVEHRAVFLNVISAGNLRVFRVYSALSDILILLLFDTNNHSGSSGLGFLGGSTSIQQIRETMLYMQTKRQSSMI